MRPFPIMFLFWEIAIAPLLEATAARRVVEIGALRGAHTRLIIDRLGPEAELHVIDPSPAFDPAEHERRFAGQYVFHGSLSLDVLGNLPPMDAALIDGDHNWYTVYNELRLLRAVARNAGAPLPLLILHDVGWPYGRRDLYYAPETIPEQFRQPWRRAGMRPGAERLVKGAGGLNPAMCNAEVEGGPRNGVMTALEDFMAEHDRPLRRVVIPVYFGLAIVAEEERLDRQPALAAELDRLEGVDGQQRLLELAEDVRLRAMLNQHNVYFQRSEQVERATARYLKVIKAALLGEHYLETEVRLAHLTTRVAAGRPPASLPLRDPVRHDQQIYRRLLSQRTGAAGPDAEAAASFLPYTAMGRGRLDHLERCLDIVRAESVPGDLAECGGGRAGGAIFMRAYLDAHEMPDRRVWIAGRFGTPVQPLPPIPPEGVAGFGADLDLVRDGFERFQLLDDRVRFLQGPFAGPGEAPMDGLALVRIGGGIGADSRAVLEHLYDRLAVGGFVIVDDHADPVCQTEVESFRTAHGITAAIERIDGSAVSWRKTASDPARTSVQSGVVADHPDLSVVVVVPTLHSEATARTLHSLSRVYQEGIDGVAYEVLVVCRSDGDDPIDHALVERFGPEFRSIGRDAQGQCSPERTIEWAIKAARGGALLLLNGADVLTPGVLRFGLAGLATHACAVVATQPWDLGPDPAPSGADKIHEDRIFQTINWPTDGYRLFDVGQCAGARDWFEDVGDSNCLFVGRTLLERVGAFDDDDDDDESQRSQDGEPFVRWWARIWSLPDTAVVTMLGEASFHQGKGPPSGQPESRSESVGYVGRFTSPTVRRTKPRRLSAEAFAAVGAVGNGDGCQVRPAPVPQELSWAYTDAVWRSLPWTNTTWLRRGLATAPTDLLAYQEIIARTRPDWVVECGTGGGGRSLFLASICELLGHGQVVSIDETLHDDLPVHSRLRYERGRPHNARTVRKVHELLGPSPRTLVILGSCVDRQRTVAQFDAYAPLVPVGSYVVVADTVVNGHPVWTGFGSGPAEAIKQILTSHGNFVHDPAMTKYSLTFNPGGYLRKVR